MAFLLVSSTPLGSPVVPLEHMMKETLFTAFLTYTGSPSMLEVCDANSWVVRIPGIELGPAPRSRVFVSLGR
jgi:hypothetical protein